MGFDVQPTPLEIKVILTIVLVAVYLVKGPVDKNEAKPWLQVKIGLGNCKLSGTLDRSAWVLVMTLVSRRLGALGVVRGYSVPTRISMAASGSCVKKPKSVIVRSHFQF